MFLDVEVNEEYLDEIRRCFFRVCYIVGRFMGLGWGSIFGFFDWF